MNTQPSEREQEIWSRLVKSHMIFAHALKDFFAEGVDRVSLMQKAFQRGTLATALYVAPHLKTDELCQLFKELVHISTAPGYAGAAREIICSLPREWVLANIEKVIEPMLLDENVTENEFRRMLELYSELDAGLTHRLAQQALNHPDEDIKEAGEDFLHLLSSTEKVDR